MDERIKRIFYNIISLFNLESEPNWKKVLYVIGVLWSVKKALKFLKSFYEIFLSREKDLGKKYGRGSYVMITGSTAGIGKELAFQFAKRGFKIVLVSRTEKKLKQVQQEILDAYPQSSPLIVQADFAKSMEPGFIDKIWNEVKDLNISILVNNVGIDAVEYFNEMPEKEVSRMLAINVVGGTLLTKRFLPTLAKREKSAVITLSSLAAHLPMRGYNLYSASKAFSNMLSLTLSNEHKKIDFFSVKPSEVSTPMTHHKSDIFTVSAKSCVNGIIKDFSRGKLSTNGHWNHKLQEYIYRFILPRCLFNLIWNNFVLHDVRKERSLPPMNPII